MQIFVKSLDKTFAVDLSANATLNELQEAIENVEFVPKHLQRIVKDSLSLPAGTLALSEADTVTLCMGMEGGMRAKWKKKRTRRLRRKRRKMRDRAR
jgi:ubiquitin-small subunit ribosomal protein S27Ae